MPVLARRDGCGASILRLNTRFFGILNLQDNETDKVERLMRRRLTYSTFTSSLHKRAWYSVATHALYIIYKTMGLR